MKKECCYQILEGLCSLFLLCFFANILNFPNKFAIVLGISFCGILLYLLKGYRLSIREVLLAVAFASYALISQDNFSTVITITLMPVIFCLLSKLLFRVFCINNKKSSYFYILIGMLLVGYSTHGILNSVVYILDGSGGRIWADIWTGNVLPATQQNIYFLPALSLLLPACIYMKKNKWLCGMVILADIFFLYISVLSSSRIPLLIFVISLMVELAAWVIWNRNTKIVKKVFGISVVVSILAGGLLVWMFAVNWENIQGWTFLQALNRDGGIFGNIRFKAQIQAVRQLLRYPMGGYHMELEGLTYAHNVWLDMANAAGLIPFFAFWGYTILSFFDLYKMLKKSSIGQEWKYILLGCFVAFFLFYTVEPALEANIQFMIPWIYLNGVIYECSLSDGDKIDAKKIWRKNENKI